MKNCPICGEVLTRVCTEENDPKCLDQPILLDKRGDKVVCGQCDSDTVLACPNLLCDAGEISEE